MRLGRLRRNSRNIRGLHKRLTRNPIPRLWVDILLSITDTYLHTYCLLGRSFLTHGYQCAYYPFKIMTGMLISFVCTLTFGTTTGCSFDPRPPMAGRIFLIPHKFYFA
jgi:hypothetical protein